MTRTLLIIDDDAISREVLAVLLAAHGAETIAADSGEAALALLRETAARPDGILPDGILLDAQLPGVCGVALILPLRELVSTTPIVVMSASPVSDELREAADGFLLKPAEPEAILAAFDAAGQATARVESVPISSVAPQAIIDPAVLAKFSRLSAPAVREMYAALVGDCADRMATLAAAIDADDHAGVRATAHAIRGGCAMLGVTAMREAAAALELASTAHEWPRDFAALERALAALQSLLDDPAFCFPASSI